jgi:hypothetical protein
MNTGIEEGRESYPRGTALIRRIYLLSKYLLIADHIFDLDAADYGVEAECRNIIRDSDASAAIEGLNDARL